MRIVEPRGIDVPGATITPTATAADHAQGALFMSCGASRISTAATTGISGAAAETRTARA
jgi:hypothetical protein